MKCQFTGTWWDIESFIFFHCRTRATFRYNLVEKSVTGGDWVLLYGYNNPNPGDQVKFRKVFVHKSLFTFSIIRGMRVSLNTKYSYIITIVVSKLINTFS